MQKRLEKCPPNAVFEQRRGINLGICPKVADFQIALLLVNHPFGVVVYLITQVKTQGICKHFRQLQTAQTASMKKRHLGQRAPKKPVFLTPNRSNFYP